MNNTKIGGRISEIDLTRFILERLNDNVQNVNFKMGLSNNLFWYKPYNELSKFINKDFIYNDDTYETNEIDFIPTVIVISDLGLSSNLDFIVGSATAHVGFYIEVDDPLTSETQRLLIEEIRDVMRQGYFLSQIPQRPYSNTSATGTYKTFKFVTNTGTIDYGSSIEQINGKNFVEISFSIDIEFTDMAYVGNEYLIEMAVKVGEDEFNNSVYSAYERVYPINLDMAVSHATKDKQELLLVTDKTYTGSTIEAFNQAEFKYTLDTTIEEVNYNDYPLGTIIKISTNYYKIVSPTTTPQEEQKAWETHSTWQSKGFGLTLDFVYRKQYSNETVGIISRLFNDLVEKKFGYNIYKVRIKQYNLELNGTWTFVKTLFERAFVMLANETVIELGSLQPMTIPFAVSDIE